MELNTKLLAQIAVALDAMQLQLDYNRALLIDSIGGEPVINGANDAVGIGIEVPARLLHLYGSDIGVLIQSSDSASTSQAIFEGKVHPTGDYKGKMVVLRDDTSYGAGIAFYTTGNVFPVGSSYTEKMRITSGGNTGINKIAPLSKLSVVGLPTSATGLTAGDVWIDGTTLKIVT